MIDFVLLQINKKVNCTVSSTTLVFSSSLMFRFLDQMAPLPFFILAMISRGMMGLGNNIAFTAMYAIIFQELPERVITVISLSQAFAGLVSMFTPLIGGGLYDVSILFQKLILFCNLKHFEFMFHVLVLQDFYVNNMKSYL